MLCQKILPIEERKKPLSAPEPPLGVLSLWTSSWGFSAAATPVPCPRPATLGGCHSLCGATSSLPSPLHTSLSPHSDPFPLWHVQDTCPGQNWKEEGTTAVVGETWRQGCAHVLPKTSEGALLSVSIKVCRLNLDRSVLFLMLIPGCCFYDSKRITLQIYWIPTTFTKLPNDLVEHSTLHNLLSYLPP